MANDPEQIFFKIGELSERLGVETHVLRFWEKEFTQIKPMRVGARKRLYRRKDLDLFQEIKRLLYEERFTIEGARKRLSRPEMGQGELFVPKTVAAKDPAALEQDRELAVARVLLDETRSELLKIKDLLSAPVTGKNHFITPVSK